MCLKCPKCGSDSTWYRMSSAHRDTVLRTCDDCHHEWPYIPPGVKRAFAECKRALTIWESGVPICHPDGEPAALRARRAIARAEGKEKP